jgi:hypothetical protein
MVPYDPCRCIHSTYTVILNRIFSYVTVSQLISTIFLIFGFLNTDFPNGDEITYYKMPAAVGGVSRHNSIFRQQLVETHKHWDLREIYRLAGLSDVKSDVKCDAEFFGR